MGLPAFGLAVSAAEAAAGAAEPFAAGQCQPAAGQLAEVWPKASPEVAAAPAESGQPAEASAAG